MALWAVKPGSKWVFNRQSDTYDRPEIVCPAPGVGERLGHPTQKPVKLMERLVATHTNKGDTVLDPFMGVGTTGVACQNLGRDFIGFEIDSVYYDTAKVRLSNK